MVKPLSEGKVKRGGTGIAPLGPKPNIKPPAMGRRITLREAYDHAGEVQRHAEEIRAKGREAEMKEWFGLP